MARESKMLCFHVLRRNKTLTNTSRISFIVVVPVDFVVHDLEPACHRIKYSKIRKNTPFVGITCDKKCNHPLTEHLYYIINIFKTENKVKYCKTYLFSFNLLRSHVWKSNMEDSHVVEGRPHRGNVLFWSNLLLCLSHDILYSFNGISSFEWVTCCVQHLK